MSLHTTKPTDHSVELIEAEIVAFFARSTREAAMISPAYLALWKDIYRLVQAGGKRLRPRMVCMAYRAFGGTDLARIAPVAAASELLHISMLIHDDIIDRDLMRYGVDNITASYLKKYASQLPDAADRQHYAQSAALLAGDLLLSGAHQLIAGSQLQPHIRAAAHTIFSRSVFEVAGGELLDTEAAFSEPGEVQPLAIARFKTAGYSFISPLLIGATLADATADQKEYVRQFAEQLGIAFQLQDDILGIFGNPATTGKSTTSDIRESKRTYLIECFDRLATPKQRHEFDRLFGKIDITEDEAYAVRELLVASGARSQVELEITRLQAQAIAALAAMKLNTEHHEEFIQLINKSLKRHK